MNHLIQEWLDRTVGIGPDLKVKWLQNITEAERQELLQACLNELTPSVRTLVILLDVIYDDRLEDQEFDEAETLTDLNATRMWSEKNPPEEVKKLRALYRQVESEEGRDD